MFVGHVPPHVNNYGVFAKPLIPKVVIIDPCASTVVLGDHDEVGALAGFRPETGVGNGDGRMSAKAVFNAVTHIVGNGEPQKGIQSGLRRIMFEADRQPLWFVPVTVVFRQGQQMGAQRLFGVLEWNGDIKQWLVALAHVKVAFRVVFRAI